MGEGEGVRLTCDRAMCDVHVEGRGLRGGGARVTFAITSSLEFPTVQHFSIPSLRLKN